MVNCVVSVVERVIVFDFVIRFPGDIGRSSSGGPALRSWRRLISDVAGRFGILVYSIVRRFGGASGMLQV